MLPQPRLAEPRLAARLRRREVEPRPTYAAHPTPSVCGPLPRQPEWPLARSTMRPRDQAAARRPIVCLPRVVAISRAPAIKLPQVAHILRPQPVGHEVELPPASCLPHPRGARLSHRPWRHKIRSFVPPFACVFLSSWLTRLSSWLELPNEPSRAAL